ncbi:MAG: DNA-processing protein DprA [Acutalibacteraceae bacterium]
MDAKYWIWLQGAMGAGARTDLAIDEFGSAKGVYEADDDTLRTSGVFNKKQLEKISDKSLDRAESIAALCSEKGYEIITPDLAEYPERLKLIADFPLALYVCGDKKSLGSDKIHIGVIGSRKPSQYGIDVAETISTSLASAGAVVVSGGALGIDSAAHSSAMDAGGKTVLIMGCGFGYNYLSENEPLRRRVTENGALVSEYPPGTPPTYNSFVLRNRITAGLCNGVLVVEAGRKSGSLSTANAVIRYNRDLFVITGDARGDNFLGANELAKRGARIVFSADDIMSLYGYEIRNRDSFNFSQLGEDIFNGIDVFPNGRKESAEPERAKRKTKKTEKKAENKEKRETDISAFSPDAQKIYKAIGNSGLLIDDIARQTQIQIRNVLIALTELEMAGAVECGAGNEYRIK